MALTVGARPCVLAELAGARAPPANVVPVVQYFLNTRCHRSLPRRFDEAQLMIRQGFPSQAIAPGTQVMVERRGYRHYGIATEPGRVIHYAGLIRYPHGLIEEITLSAFA